MCDIGVCCTFLGYKDFPIKWWDDHPQGVESRPGKSQFLRPGETKSRRTAVPNNVPRGNLPGSGGEEVVIGDLSLPKCFGWNYREIPVFVGMGNDLVMARDRNGAGG